MSRAKNTGQKRGWGTDLGLRDGSADPLSHAVTMRRQSTLDMVNDALARKQAVLAYQPIVQAGNFGHVAFYEGLVCILDQTGRPIPAKDFMSEVEDTETGRKIDCLALELGLGALIADPALRLSINMSARSIGYSPWMKVLQDGVATNDTVAERLILEISEPSAMSMPEVVA
ncbi:MAG: EAL domain-containing protein, partial [Pseudomonadota bacterium]